MRGMNALTGKPIDGLEQLRQSIADVLFTPIGSRVGRRDYGSLVPDLIDQAMNLGGRLRLFAATATALGRWISNFRLIRVTLAGSAGDYALQLEGTRTDVAGPNARTILTVPLRRNSTLASL
jgi:uncharacterized protein